MKQQYRVYTVEKIKSICIINTAEQEIVLGILNIIICWAQRVESIPEVMLKTAFTRCRHILKTVKNSTDRPPVHTKTAHFLPADFENGAPIGTFWKRHRINTWK